MQTPVENPGYLYLWQLGAIWGCSVKTLRKTLNKLADQLPFYDPKAKKLAPATYKKAAQLLALDI